MKPPAPPRCTSGPHPAQRPPHSRQQLHPLTSPQSHSRKHGKAIVSPLNDVRNGAGEHEEPFWHLQGHWEEKQSQG